MAQQGQMPYARPGMPGNGNMPQCGNFPPANAMPMNQSPQSPNGMPMNQPPQMAGAMPMNQPPQMAGAMPMNQSPQMQPPAVARSITTVCTSCGKSHQVPLTSVGSAMNCTGCGHPFVVLPQDNDKDKFSSPYQQPYFYPRPQKTGRSIALVILLGIIGLSMCRIIDIYFGVFDKFDKSEEVYTPLESENKTITIRSADGELKEYFILQYSDDLKEKCETFKKSGDLMQKIKDNPYALPSSDKETAIFLWKTYGNMIFLYKDQKLDYQTSSSNEVTFNNIEQGHYIIIVEAFGDRFDDFNWQEVQKGRDGVTLNIY